MECLKLDELLILVLELLIRKFKSVFREGEILHSLNFNVFPILINKNLMDKQQHTKMQFVFDFFSGGISGVVAKTVCAPVERVKLLM